MNTRARGLKANESVTGEYAGKGRHPDSAVGIVWQFSESAPAASWVAATIETDGIDPTSTLSAGAAVDMANQIEKINNCVSARFWRESTSSDFSKDTAIEGSADDLNIEFQEPGTNPVVNKHERTDQ